MTDYVKQRDGGYWIAGKRISLDSLVYAFRRGQSPESMGKSFPLLSLEEIYGAIAFYLAHQAEVDESIIRDEAEFEKMRQHSRESNAAWHKKIDEARSEIQLEQR